MLQSPMAFAAGMAAMVVIGAFFRLARGFRLNLLLIHRDTGVSVAQQVKDQVVIPVTLENRRPFSWRFIRERRWEESVDLVLADDEGQYANLAFTFHPWLHFQVTVGARPEQPSAIVKLNSRPVPTQRRVRVVDGDRLEVGRRRYLVRVTASVSEVATALAGSI